MMDHGMGLTRRGWMHAIAIDMWFSNGYTIEDIADALSYPDTETVSILTAMANKAGLSDALIYPDEMFEQDS